MYLTSLLLLGIIEKASGFCVALFLQSSLVLRGPFTEVDSGTRAHSSGSISFSWVSGLILRAAAQRFYRRSPSLPRPSLPFLSLRVTASKAEGLQEFPAVGAQAAGEPWQVPDLALEASQACSRGTGGAFCPEASSCPHPLALAI